jgi:hypothetical protein
MNKYTDDIYTERYAIYIVVDNVKKYAQNEFDFDVESFTADISKAYKWHIFDIKKAADRFYRVLSNTEDFNGIYVERIG